MKNILINPKDLSLLNSVKGRCRGSNIVFLNNPATYGLLKYSKPC